MPTNWLPYIPVAALAISVFALIVSGANLGWSIYKELGLRPRVKVRFVLAVVQHPTFVKPVSRFIVSVTNFGPGKLRLNMLHLRDIGFWKRIFLRKRFAALIYDYENPLGGRLPAELEVGQSTDLTFPVDVEFMKNGYTHVGITDGFGRLHWCSSSEMRQAKRDLDAHRKNV